MKLRTVRITNFKSIDDTGEFSLGDLTCLAGKNESGKTAILQALRRLNPVEPSEREFDKTMEFPRSKLHSAEGDNQQVLHTVWDLSDEEISAVEAVLGPGALKDNSVRVTKSYQDSNPRWAVSLDEKKIIAALMERVVDLTANAQARVNEAESIRDMKSIIAKQKDKATVGEQELLRLVEEFREGRPLLAAIDVLSPNLPRILYFPTYESMPGRVALETLIRRTDAPDIELTQEDRIFLALLKLAGTSPEEVRDQELSEALIAKLEGVSNFISQQIFSYWSQNRHLKVRFHYGEALPEDPEDGHIFQTRIENTRHGVTVGFDERSAGFVWFFSFLVWFSVAKSEYGDRLVILLDEPGLSLHGTAQADLLRYVKEKLLQHYQVIYTTHSPFMIDAEDLFTVRTVEDVVGEEGETLGTKVGDEVLSSDADTIFPLRAVLGYDITQSLFVGEHTLLVEGPSDLLYLRWASNELGRRGRTALDDRWTICPTGGIDKISSFIALFGGNELHIAVLADFHAGDKKKVHRLRESEILRGGHVFTADAYVDQEEADVEDLLGRELYGGLIAAAYELENGDRLPDEKPADASGLVAQEVKEHMRTVSVDGSEYDHYRPAEFLLGAWHELKESLDGIDEALDRFETLFEDLNSLL